ncbi:hypothetical protein KKF32_01595, partial [Patescibacteria group bacterium]|nr:hypothetical protein [Patescibacteria group bacterium]
PVILGVISALLFYDIPIAYAPTNENSTPPMVKTKDFGDSIQGYNKIPKVIRGGIPFILGFKNKIANKISNKLSKKTEKEFITLYHGTNNFTDIVKNGFKKTKLYFTPVAFDAERYSLGWSKIIEPFVFQFKLLKKEFNELYKIGKILPDPRDANAFYTKDGNLIKKINNLIKRDYVKK